MPGYLEALVISPQYRRRGTGTLLLQNIESFIKTAGKDMIHISCYPPAITAVPVLPDTPEYKFIVNRGFRPLIHEMKLRLLFRDFTFKKKIAAIKERLSHEGIEIRYFEPAYKQSFSRLMEAHFWNWWHSCFKQNMKKDNPLPVLIAAHGERVVGFVGFVHVEENKRASFGPGVDPKYRKRGIGKVLVNLWAAEVKKMGAEESLIETADDNYSAQRIYFDMGYKKIGEFCGKFEKKLK